jgi:hypothetical protein
MCSNLRLTVLSEARTKAQAGCYAGGITPRQSGPVPCMSGLDATGACRNNSSLQGHVNLCN